MNTQERLQTADALLLRARELMKEAESPETSSREAITRKVMMADTYGRIAQGYLESIKVRQL